MTTYEIFVHDERYSVPTLHLVTLRDEDAARQAAASLLKASPRHRGVELCCDGEQLLILGACDERRMPGREFTPMRMANGG